MAFPLTPTVSQSERERQYTCDNDRLASIDVNAGSIAAERDAPIRAHPTCPVVGRDDESLPFPTGIATAELIRAMHASGQKALRRSRSLLKIGLAAMAAVWLQNGRPALIPQASFLPFRVAGLPARTFTLGISWSPLMLGLAAIIGLLHGP